jgi:hypothetical protein
MSTDNAVVIENDYDSPCKEALERYFPQFMALLFPAVFAEINWAIPHKFLETELQKIVRDAESGRKYMDKLVKVFALNGTETWFLIHIEIQGTADSHFNQRMFCYYYRLIDSFPKQQIASFAVLTNQRHTKHLGYFQKSFANTALQFTYPVINLRDWQNKMTELEANDNPFAIVILAQLMAHQTSKKPQQRKKAKFKLIRLLYERDYQKQDILELLRFIDWMLSLPKILELQLQQEINLIGEEQKMRYVTSWERLGETRGEANALLKLLKLKFGAVLNEIEEKVISADKAQLDYWLGRILTAESLESLFAENAEITTGNH